MELQEIQVIIGTDGRVRIEVRGVHGPACLDLTRDLEAALGDQVEVRTSTPEMMDLAEDENQHGHETHGIKF